MTLKWIKIVTIALKVKVSKQIVIVTLNFLITIIENGDFGKECYNMIKDYKQHNLGVCVFEEIMEPLH
jgi:predicted SnoaL-like aldol condensation-catalyzing enzyme